MGKPEAETIERWRKERRQLLATIDELEHKSKAPGAPDNLFDTELSELKIKLISIETNLAREGEE